ncbi:MAG: hypothetical protein PHQ88_07760 [Bacteroides sp.]|nr:hypothetical protein [Bacteroides sp.]MDD4055614.1 hypothetical protein [Bacteroides sp.]MDD4720735.1 hypothetical protein [Bacteroides sp.]
MIHINIARRILERGDLVSLKVFKKNGELMECHNVVSITSYFRGGTRKLKFIASGEIRQIRDVCIVEINDEEVYL